MTQVQDNPERQRYELQTPEGTAIAAYHDDGGKRVFTHTEVPEALEGQGVGSQLVQAALDDARQQGLQVVPECPFVADYIEKHQEYQDLVPPEAWEGLGRS